jgi:hypothetical protein
MALHGVGIPNSHARNWYHARPITRDVSRGSNLGHGRGTDLSWPIGTSHGHLWPDMERELLLMGQPVGLLNYRTARSRWMSPSVASPDCSGIDCGSRV